MDDWFFQILFFSCDLLHSCYKQNNIVHVYVVHIELKGEGGRDFVCMATKYLSRLWSS